MNNITNFDRLNIITNIINNKENYIRFLKFCKKFYAEDYKNQLLIFLQYPDAIKVGSFMDWKKEGRNIKKNPRKIFMYGYYREKKNDMLENQIDIKGKINKSRKATIEYFNCVPYRKICKYDFVDTYIDRKRKVSLKNVNEAIEYSEDELLNCLINSHFSNFIEGENVYKTKVITPEMEFYSNFTKHQKISLLIHQISNYYAYKNSNFKNNLIIKFISDSVGFLVSNYFGFDLKSYCFFELSEYLKLDIYEKIEVGSVIQKETQKIINLILKRLDNENQICA